MIETLTFLLAAAKERLNAANITRIWYETDGGWLGDHTVSIETSDEKEVDVEIGRSGESRIIRIVRLSKVAENAVREALSSLDLDAPYNSINFDSSKGRGNPSNVLVYSPSAMIAQRQRKIAQLQLEINDLNEEIIKLEQL